MTHDSHVLNTRVAPQGAHRPAAALQRQGDRAGRRVRPRATSARWPSSRRRGPATGWPRATSRSRCRRSSCRRRSWRSRSSRKAKGDEEKVFTALRRLQEEDPTIDLHRDAQTGEQIVAGLSQMHVEVIVDRLKSRFGVEVALQAAARALPGDDPRPGQGPRAPQEADRRSRPVRRLPHRDPPPHDDGLRVRQRDQGRRDPAAASSRRSRRAWTRRWPTGRSRAIRSRTCRSGSSTAATTRSTRRSMAFKMAGSQAMSQAMEQAGAGAAGADHARDAVGARGHGRRRHRRPQLAARAPAGDGAARTPG